MNKPTIRQAKPTEVKKLQLLNDLAHTNDPTFDPDIIPQWGQSPAGKDYFQKLVSDDKALCLVVEDDDQLTGYLAARPMKVNYRQSKYLEIENITTHPNHQRQGVGTKLFEQCLSWAKDKGFQKVYISSYYANKTAISFYKKLGFQPIDISLERKI